MRRHSSFNSVRREQRLWILSPSLEEDMLMLTCHHLFAHSWGRLLSLHLASAIEVCMFQELGQAFIGSASAFSPGKWGWHKVHSHLPPELRGKSQFRTEWKTFYPGNWKPASVYLGTEPSVPPKQCAGSYAPGQPSQIGSTWGTHNNSWSSLKSHLATVHKILVLSPSKQ